MLNAIKYIGILLTGQGSFVEGKVNRHWRQIYAIN